MKTAPWAVVGVLLLSATAGWAADPTITAVQFEDVADSERERWIDTSRPFTVQVRFESEHARAHLPYEIILYGYDVRSQPKVCGRAVGEDSPGAPAYVSVVGLWGSTQTLLYVDAEVRIGDRRLRTQSVPVAGLLHRVPLVLVIAEDSAESWLERLDGRRRLGGLESPAGRPADRWSGGHDVRVSSTAGPLALHPVLLPDEAAAYASVESVVLTSPALWQRLRQPTRRALADWCAAGGRLFVIGPRALRPDAELSVVIGGAARGKASVAYGHGRVTAVQEDGRTAAEAARGVRPAMPWLRWFGSVDDGWQRLVGLWEDLRGPAASIPELRSPPSSFVYGFLGLYILLVIPIQFYVLRLLRRRHWAWATSPLLVALFVAWAAQTGAGLRPDHPVLNTYGVIELENGGRLARATEVSAAVWPRRERYSVALPPGAFGAAELQPRQGARWGRTAEYLTSDAEGRLSMADVPATAGGVRVYGSQAVRATSGDGVTFDVRLVEGRAVGSVTNELRRPLTGVRLEFDHLAFALPDLPPGRTAIDAERTPADAERYPPTASTLMGEVVQRKLAALAQQTDTVPRVVLTGWARDLPTNAEVAAADLTPRSLHRVIVRGEPYVADVAEVVVQPSVRLLQGETSLMGYRVPNLPGARIATLQTKPQPFGNRGPSIDEAADAAANVVPQGESPLLVWQPSLRRWAQRTSHDGSWTSAPREASALVGPDDMVYISCADPAARWLTVTYKPEEDER